MREPLIKKNRITRKKGGKTFASSKPVSLKYSDKAIVCDVCGSNNYTETIGAIEKSKVRSGVGQFFFGDTAQILDNTSIIMYTCNTCGMCKVIRNQDPIRITASPL